MMIKGLKGPAADFFRPRLGWMGFYFLLQVENMGPFLGMPLLSRIWVIPPKMALARIEITPGVKKMTPPCQKIDPEVAHA